MQAGGIALQGAGIDGGATRIRIGAAERQRARTILDQCTGARHDAREAAIGGLREDQRCVVDDIALQARGIALQRTRTDRGASTVCVGATEGEYACTGLGQAARTRHHAGIGAVRGLIEDQRGIVDDIADKAAGVDLQGTGADRGASRIGVGTAQRQRAGTCLGQAARTGNHTRIGAVNILSEDQRSVVDDIALQTGGITLQGTRRDGGAARVRVGSAERHRARPEFGEATRPGNRTRISAVARLIERERGVVDDCACQTGGRALQGTGIDSRAAGIGIGSAQGQCTGAGLGETAGTGNISRIGAIRCLVEDQCGVIGHVALQARAVALQGTGADDGATAIGVGTSENQGGCALLDQVASAGNRVGVGAISGLVEDQGRVVDDRTLQADGIAL